MFQIQDTLVTLDLAERFFCCDLDKCLGACCIEGDAGAPVTEREVAEIEKSSQRWNATCCRVQSRR